VREGESELSDSKLWENIKKIAYGADKSAPNTISDSCKLHANSNIDRGDEGSFYLETTKDVAGVSLVTNLKENNYTSDSPQENGKNLSGRAVLGRGIWVDAVYYKAGNGNSVPYFDFYIKACWTPLGNMPDSQSVTTVRIYDDV
jgi:hypothetical protein